MSERSDTPMKTYADGLLRAEVQAVAQKLIYLAEFHEKSEVLRDLAIRLRDALRSEAAKPRPAPGGGGGAGLRRHARLQGGEIKMTIGIDEQIAFIEGEYQDAERNLWDEACKHFSEILATLRRMKAIEDAALELPDAPHFQEWAQRVYGDVRPCDIDRIETAFNAGMDAAK